MVYCFKKIISPFFVFIFLLTFSGIWFIYKIDTLIKRGVDLVGGTYITLQVKIAPIINRSLNKMGGSLLSSLKKKTKDYTATFIVDHNKNGFFLKISSSEKDIKKYIEDDCLAYKNDFDIEYKDNNVTLSFKKISYEEMLNNAIEKNIIALRKRIDPLGAGEILITRNQDNIIIELPNVQNPEQARLLIGTTAYLTIKPVLDHSNKKEELEKIYKKMLNSEVIICSSADKDMWYVLPQDTDLTGSFLKKAVVQYDNRIRSAPVIQFTFNSIGGQKFRELTRKSIGKMVAISLDDVVLTAPMVNEEIGSEGIIQGNFTLESAQNLATLLQAGSFEAPVEYVQERVIEPILGKQTIKQGLFACFVGMILLLIASVITYSFCGLIAFIVLLFNLFFTLFGIYLIGGTLTLSGIAGLILTIGMAIDASILIFEKIKEELNEQQKTKNFFDAVNNGFSKTIEIIIDANITHFIVALVLFYMGSGPLKGFAVSMIVGIFSTIISGVFLLRGFLNYFLKRIGLVTLKI